MNKKVKSLIVRAAVLAMIVGVLPTSSVPAGAQDPPSLVWSDTIFLTGGTISLTCDINCLVPTPPSVNYLPLVGGSGAYTFQVKLCTGISDPSISEGAMQDLGSFNCNIQNGWTSTGTYDNIVCGTGIAQGNIGGQIIGPAPDEQLAGAQYTIVFVGGQGVLAGTVDELESNGVRYPAILAGTVQLSPLGDIPGPPACVTGFFVKAEINILQLPTQP
jgi:hypothetical protein